ncbi:Retrovirus-related Pol polyprotein from transposon 17.6 [Dictyocoela muelleri]|nr:Retrovirus-related Pol polyprotein from transposon 17.6 [Dictyocoela muelleri]
MIKKSYGIKIVKKIVDDIKTYISRDNLLKFPKSNEKFILQCDASDSEIGSVLLQTKGVISHYSREFTNYEMNYSVLEKEMFAILNSLLHFREIIHGCYVEIYTNNRNCTFNKGNSKRIERLKLLMNDFNFKIFLEKAKIIL